MSKIYGVETTVVNKETGELIRQEVSTKKAIIVEPDYVKVYINAMSLFISGDEVGMETNLLLEMAKIMTYADDTQPNSVSMTKFYKEKIANQLHSTVPAIEVTLNRLVKKNLVKRIGRGVYELNPLIFARGDWYNINKIQMQWTDEELRTQIEFAKETRHSQEENF